MGGLIRKLQAQNSARTNKSVEKNILKDKNDILKENFEIPSIELSFEAIPEDEEKENEDQSKESFKAKDIQRNDNNIVNNVSTLDLRGEGARFSAAKKGFQGFRSGNMNTSTKDLTQLQDIEFLRKIRTSNKTEKSKKEVEELVKLISETNITEVRESFNPEVIRRIAKKLEVIDIEENEIIIHKGSEVPFFFCTLEASFASSNETNLKLINLEALIFPSASADKFYCQKRGKVFFISRMSCQNIIFESVQEQLKAGASLLEHIEAIPALKSLSETERKELASSLEHVEFIEGEFLMKQGEIGKEMFFLESGSVKVMDQHGDVLVTRGPGEYIGEGALLSEESERRNADVVAETAVKALKLAKDDFDAYLGNFKQQMHHGFVTRILSTVQVFKNLGSNEVSRIASLIEEVQYKDGEFVVRQGEVGERFYILKEGILDCRLRTVAEDGNVEFTSVGTLLKGDYFGEGALLTSEPRRCDVIVVGGKPATLWSISQDDFTHSFSDDVKDIFKNTFSARKEADCGSGVAKIDWSSLDEIKLLGSGSFGTVTLVRSRLTGKALALKRIRKATVLAKKQQRFIRNERKFLAEVDSRFIVKLYATYNKSDSVYMLLEVCLGGELYAFMKDNVNLRMVEAGLGAAAADTDEEQDMVGCFQLDMQVKFFFACIVLGISHMHEKDIIHRDLKPENLLVGEHGYLKLVDFGFAKRIVDKRTYSLCGTPEYIAPEVYKRIGHGKPVDFWAAGVILYEMASGFSPFHVPSQNSWDCFIEISRYEKHFPHIQFPETFGDELPDLLLCLMHPNQVKRYGSAILGLSELQGHPFFHGFPWEAVESGEFRMETSLLPAQPEYSLDAKNFGEDIKDKHVEDKSKLTDEQLDLLNSDPGSWEEGF
eukprot:snap_masked-scaffold_19-processed-gene-1.24-mRNA-1 protein AED:0.03 eAED:0.06 QI:0/-1/0/1/-1/1/1/0/885